FPGIRPRVCCNVVKSKSSRKDLIMIPHRSRRTGTPKPRTALRQNRSKAMYHPRVESLEERCLLSGSPPILYGPLPAVTIGLTNQQIDHADAVINWNATMLRAIMPKQWSGVRVQRSGRSARALVRQYSLLLPMHARPSFQLRAPM